MHPATSLTRTWLLQGAFALLACAVLSASANAVSSNMPPVAEPQSAEHHVGKVIWADLVTPDLAGAERFYGGLFGWTFRNSRAGDTNYAVARLDGRPVSGLFERTQPSTQRRQPAWLTFIAVSDVESTRKIALANGATVLAEPRYLPHRGRQAVLSDPHGAVFAVLASSSGDPPDYMAQPGEWIWSSLLATDPDTDAAFYQQLFGYDVFELQSDDGLQHLIFVDRRILESERQHTADGCCPATSPLDQFCQGNGYGRCGKHCCCFGWAAIGRTTYRSTWQQSCSGRRSQWSADRTDGMVRSHDCRTSQVSRLNRQVRIAALGILVALALESCAVSGGGHDGDVVCPSATTSPTATTMADGAPLTYAAPRRTRSWGRTSTGASSRRAQLSAGCLVEANSFHSHTSAQRPLTSLSDNAQVPSAWARSCALRVPSHQCGDETDCTGAMT